MSNPKDLEFNLKENTNDVLVKPQIPKKLKHKFMKDLNHRSNLNVRSLTGNQNSWGPMKTKDLKTKKTNSRQEQFDSLIEKTIQGARIIKGQWRDNKMNGMFIIQYQNGCKFEGTYQNDLKVEGKMEYKFANCTYEGSFFGQKFSGYGKLTYNGGRTIEGEWDNLQFVGNATITYPNGDVYYGPVDQQLYKHGQGYLFFKNGYKYVGSFKHGSITGFGVYYKDEEVVKSGIWHKGNLIREASIQDQSMFGTQYFLNNFSKQITELAGKQKTEHQQPQILCTQESLSPQEFSEPMSKQLEFQTLSA